MFDAFLFKYRSVSPACFASRLELALSSSPARATRSVETEPRRRRYRQRRDVTAAVGRRDREQVFSAYCVPFLSRPLR